MSETERDELADVISKALGDVTGIFDTSGEEDRGLADAILAAGYRRPRTVTTVEELDALPHASVVLDASNYCREAAKVSGGNIWRSMGPATVRASRELPLPATVLHEPEATK